MKSGVKSREKGVKKDNSGKRGGGGDRKEEERKGPVPKRGDVTR